jgi:hypothetical protein
VPVIRQLTAAAGPRTSKQRTRVRSGRGSRGNKLQETWADVAVGSDTSGASTEDCNSSATSVVLCVKKWTEVDGFNSFFKAVCGVS